MLRLTARLLLFFALVGNLAPLALAATAPPPHACCLRKGVHHCQDSLASENGQPVIRGANCCNGDCCRAVTTAQWAHPQPRLAVSFQQSITARFVGTQSNSPATASAELHSSRAPPAS
ncbi:MAG: hypothetical protein WAM04_21910 [Candidatus Sulfotelmatobacter sp.]